MSYKKPICECGNELLYDDCRTVNKSYKINRNGKTFKNPVVTYAGEVENQTLYCEDCSTMYALEFDDEERIVKGDVIS